MRNNNFYRFFITIFFLASSLNAITADESQNAVKQTMALGLGLEANMNSPVNFAGGAAFNFDYNLPIPISIFSFATGFNITASNNFSGISVLELSGMFRWYFLNGTHNGFFAQANLGYNHADYEGSPVAVISELRGGIRLPLGSFYIEPYGRIGYPVVWGAGAVFGMRIKQKVRSSESLTDEPLTAESIAAFFEEHGMSDASVEATDEGIRITLLNIQFMPDSAILVESERWKIQETANILRRIPNVRVQVSGHTALAGTAESMMRLSRERADNIASFLVVLGAVKSENISTVGYGATRPVASNATPEGMAANRRIEIMILED